MSNGITKHADFWEAYTLKSAYNEVAFNKKFTYNEGKPLHQIYPFHL